jgi:hypothetical protein
MPVILTTQEAEVGGSQVQEQPGQHSKTLLKKKRNRRKYLKKKANAMDRHEITVLRDRFAGVNAMHEKRIKISIRT